MKGVILAGGLGTRLRPLTEVTNKHLLPVYDRPMIYYPIQSLLTAGITEIMIVTGGDHAGDFLKLLKNGKHLGIKRLEYAYQEGEGGIADALKLAEEFADGEKICVVLGDNLIEGNLRKAAGDFFTQPSGAKILLKEVQDPERFGVVRFEGEGAFGFRKTPNINSTQQSKSKNAHEKTLNGENLGGIPLPSPTKAGSWWYVSLLDASYAGLR
ncbi:MAG: sugar phosphate nucleotidyltransferase [bacterium]|nr:sugar phosphate nucleotidyltransferase [bacterium]